MTVLDFLGLGDSGPVEGQTFGEDEFSIPQEELLTNQGGIDATGAEEPQPAKVPEAVYLQFKGVSDSAASRFLNVTQDTDGDLIVDYFPDQAAFDDFKFFVKLDGDNTLRRVPNSAVLLDGEGDVRIHVLTQHYDLVPVLKGSQFTKLPSDHAHNELHGIYYMDTDMVLKARVNDIWEPVKFAHDGQFDRAEKYLLL
jgi:hypothetical protein